MTNNKIVKMNELIKEQYDNIAGIQVMVNGRNVYENYFNGYGESHTIHIASVTKSILSALIGIALDNGAISSIEQNILDFFPGYKIKRGEKTIQKITIKNLLTMTAPYKFKSEPYTKVYSSEDWTKAVLDLLGGRAPLGEFKYTTIGIQVLSGILQNATGRSVSDFAMENLFEPLGIEGPPDKRIETKEEHFAFLTDRNVHGWVIDPGGVNTAGWGLALGTGSLAKIGQLYLNRGIWKGRRIVSSEWIEDSSREHSRWGDKSYGYLWWILDGEDINSYAALGDGGNVIYVSPEKKMVVAITSRFKPRARDRIELIREHIMPLFDKYY